MSNFLKHHGIPGQTWGIRNGPPYPLSRRRSIDLQLFNRTVGIVKSKCSNSTQPFKKEPMDLKTAAERGQLNQSDVVKCAKLASNIFDHASAKEPTITQDMVDAARKTGSKMYGLEYRLKQPTSIAAKIGADAKEDGISFSSAAKSIKDAVRYTVVSDDSSYASSYRNVASYLASKGYTESRCKNNFAAYKEGKILHKSIQSVFQDPSGYKFEVQFQTPSSQAAKELKIPIYEERRRAGITPKRQKELERQMVDLAEMVKNPKGVYLIKSH